MSTRQDCPEMPQQLRESAFVGMYRVVSQRSYRRRNPTMFLRWRKELNSLCNMSRTIKLIPFNLVFARAREANKNGECATKNPPRDARVLSRDYFSGTGALTVGASSATTKQQVHNKVIDCSKEKLRSITRPHLKRCGNF